MDEILYKVFAKLDEHNCIIGVESTAFHSEEELLEQGYIQIDEGSDGTIYGHAQPNYLRLKHDKTMYDENILPNYKLVENEVKEVEPTEKEEWFIKPQKIAQEKANQEAMLQDMMMKAQQVAFLVELPDEEAVKIPYCYDEWQKDKLYKVGDRVQVDGKLWKCRQEHTSQENWKPSIETASMWEVIDKQHGGTLKDPIPYDQTMTVYKDKYYIEEGIIYKCLEDSGQPLYASCKDLPRYFEAIER